jgi:hypothetical protein
MRCKDCSQVRGRPYKRSHLVALRPTKISAGDPASTWCPASADDVQLSIRSPPTKRRSFAGSGSEPLTTSATCRRPGVFPDYPPPVVRDPDPDDR